MKKSLLLAASAVALLGNASLAGAADFAVKAPAAVAHVFSWTGCYIGVHGGGGVMHDTWADINGSGGVAGGQIGCNYQDGNWVFGAEGEGYWSGMNSRFRSVSFGNNTEGVSGYSDTARNKYDYTIAARAGIAFDHTLVYGKAGWVWGRFDFEYDTICRDCTYSERGSATLNGLLVGVGVEHAFLSAPNWTVKAEYDFLKYGGADVAFTACDAIRGCAPQPYHSTSQSAEKHLFKIGVNYLFTPWR